jgi:acyl-CoA thioesterase FadM
LFPWVRLARICLVFLGKPRVDLLSVTRVRIRIWPNDLDSNLHVNNGRYLTLADLGRFDWFVRTGVFAAARKHKASPVVGDAMAKFRREIKAFETVEIESRLVGWSGRWGFLEHRFVLRGRVVGMVVVRGAFRSASGTLDSWDFLQHLGDTRSSPPLPAWALDFQNGAESMSTMLRDEEKARGLRS